MLVGRETERQAIDTLLSGARVGGSGVLVLTGEPGIGKTALLAAAETLVGDMRVLRAQGVPSEQSVPFAGLLQLLRPLLPLLDHIPPPQSRALSSALLLEPGGDAEPSRFAVGAATLSLICRAAEDRPLAVLVDDAHLLDSPSAEALVFAARRVVADAVAIICTARPDDGGGGAAWQSLPTLTVAGLDLAAAGELVAAASGAAMRPDQLVRLHGATAGNPLALLELGACADRLAAMPPDASPAVSEQLTRSFIGRAAGLSPATGTALLVAASDSASVATIARACVVLGFPAAQLAEAEDAGLITLRGDRVEFRHPLVRSAVYGAAEPQLRRAVHRALAAVVPGNQTDRLAWHLSEGAVAPDEETASTLAAVAAQASARGAYAIAANAYERAADLTVVPARAAGRLAAAGEAAWLAGRTDRAVELLDRALACRPDPLVRAHLAELSGAVDTRSGSLRSALDTLMTAAADVGTAEPDLGIRLLADAIHVCLYLAEPGTATRAGAMIEALVDSAADPEALALGSMACGMALVLAGSGRQGIEKLRATAGRLATAEDVAADTFRLPLRVQGTLWLRDSDPQRLQIRAAIDQLRERAALGSLPYLLMHIARDAATTDRWDDAEAAYVEGIKLAGETGHITEQAVSLAGLACLYARQGRIEECQANAALAAELCDPHQIRLGSFWLTFAKGDAAIAAGDPAGAIGHYEALESLLAATLLGDPDQSCAPELVAAYLQLGRHADALRVSAAFAAEAVAKGQPWSLARSQRAQGLCDDSARGEAHFAAALEFHAATPDRYETARTELAFGAWLRRHRKRVQARPLLRSALAAFERLGARPWADNAARELEATGETARRREASAVDTLTPQERQIAQLLAQGRTTRETAAALFISPKTVEYHLRHIYTKLEIRSRTALASLFST